MIVKADPYGSDDAVIHSREPCVFRAVGRTVLAPPISRRLQCAPHASRYHPAVFAEDIGVQRAWIRNASGVLITCGAYPACRLRDQRPLLLRSSSGTVRRCFTLLRNRDLFQYWCFPARRISSAYCRALSPGYRTRAGDFRFRFEDYAALIVLNLADEIRVDQETAVRHHNRAQPASAREGGGAQRQRSRYARYSGAGKPKRCRYSAA